MGTPRKAPSCLTADLTHLTLNLMQCFHVNATQHKHSSLCTSSLFPSLPLNLPVYPFPPFLPTRFLFSSSLSTYFPPVLSISLISLPFISIHPPHLPHSSHFPTSSSFLPAACLTSYSYTQFQAKFFRVRLLFRSSPLHK